MNVNDSTSRYAPNGRRAWPAFPVLAGALSALSVSAFALSGAVAQPVTPAPRANLTAGANVAPRPQNAAGVNILILAVEPLAPDAPTGGVAGAGSPVLPAPVPANALPPLPPPPINPVPNNMAAISPANWVESAPGGRGQFLQVAHHDHDNDADRLRLEPDPAPPPAYYPRGQAPLGAPFTGGATDRGGAPIGGVPSSAGLPSDTAPLPYTPTFSTPLAASTGGMSQNAVGPLRRALIQAGYTDCLDATLDGPSVIRAIDARRLTARAPLQLRHAIGALNAALNAATPVNAAPAAAAPADTMTGAEPAPGTEPAATSDSPISDSDLHAAAQAAARIGQAMGYRAVIVVSMWPAPARSSAGATPGNTPPATGAGMPVSYLLLVTDSLRETAEPIVFDANGTDSAALEVAAATGASLAARRLNDFSAVADSQRMALAQTYLQSARTSATAGDLTGAQDLLNQSLALNPSSSDANKLLGDVLTSTDPAGATQAYRRAVEYNISDGETWAKIAISQTLGTAPDWPRAVDAGDRALLLGYDSGSLRTALAIAQLARAQLYRDADPPRDEKADAVEASALDHLSHALSFEPDNPDVIRRLASTLITSRRYVDAVRVLDRIAPQYPRDADLQTYYALALMQVDGREEDAFAVWARAWKLTGSRPNSQVDEVQYDRLAEGFDRRVDSIGQSAGRLSLSVSSGALSREMALVQLSRLQEDMTDASTALNSLQPPPNSAAAGAQESRALAATLLDQALRFHHIYLETGQGVYQNRALEAHRQALANLRLARAGM